jgi:two-component system response regulator YesN
MIIDDEPLLCQGIIKKIGRMGLPLELVGEAGDGREGLRRIAEAKPDIVLTDIRMPGMDGLTLIQEAKDLDPKLQFIIISGYDEFAYAKKGLQFGVFDYLLKPVDDEELRSSLMRIIAKVEQERRQSSLGEELRHLRKQSDETLRQQLLTKLIQQGDKGAAVEQDEKLSAMKEHCREFVVVLFEVDMPTLPYRSFLPGDEALLRFAVANTISMAMASSGREGVLFHHGIYDQELVYVLGDRTAVDMDAVRRELAEVLTGIRRHLKLEATIGCGTTVGQMSGIRQSYQQARLALRDKIIHGRNRIYFAAPPSGGKAHRSSILAEDDELILFRFLNECNGPSINRWLTQRIETIASEEGASFRRLESFCVDLYLLYRKYLLLQTNMPEWIIGEMEDVLSWLDGLEDWRQIAAGLKRLTDNIIGRLNTLRHASEYNIMDEVKRYIDANLHEQLTLQTIAETFYIHPNYFSRRFKERFHESFVNYLTAERIRKAERLLRDTQLKIQHVAELVGFADAAYFSSVFRKATGMTPNQYRSRAAEAAQ